MELTPWNPWKEIEEAQAEVTRLLGAALEKLRHVVSGRAISFVPVTDIVEAEDEYRLFLSLPGMLEEDIDITVDERLLVVRGEREPPYPTEGVFVHHRQWRYGYFERRFQLPQKVEREKIRADYDAGVLIIRILKGGASTNGETGGGA
jgi:HSP20 family protein